MAISREVRQLRRDVVKAFKKAGVRVGLRRAWNIFDHDAGLVERCPTCYNAAYNEATDPDCPTCFGTGFDGGYHPLELLWGFIDMSGEDDIKRDEGGVIMDTSSRLKAPYPPIINDGDLIVEVTGLSGGSITGIGLTWAVEGGVNRETLSGKVSNNKVGRLVPDDITVSQQAPLKPLFPDDIRSQPEFWGL